MLIENIKEVMETPNHLKAEEIENKVFESVDAFLNKNSGLIEIKQESIQNEFLQSTQFDYNMEGESLW